MAPRLIYFATALAASLWLRSRDRRIARADWAPYLCAVVVVYGVAGKMYEIVRPIRDSRYLRFIRRFACVGCKTERRQREAMHTGPRGMSQKASDLDALPGCNSCHRELHRIGPMKFQTRHKIDFAELQIMFRGFYRVEFPQKKEPAQETIL